MEYEAMDEEAVQPSGSMIPIALAVLGIVLGTAGLYFGFNANKRLNPINTSIQESSTSAAEIEKSVTFFDARIAELEEQILEQSKMLNRLRAYSSQSEQSVKKLVSELNKNREQIVKTAKQLNEIKAGGVQISTASDTSSGQSAQVSNNVDNSPAKFEKERTYVIESGDYFSKIAVKFGVSVQAIIDANPDADPRRLAIGQEIVIPAE
ncbi:MAG: LysM repeat protein [Lentimonas sp.]|jgi:LysM repeat protein